MQDRKLRKVLAQLNQEWGQLPYNPIQEDTWLDYYKLHWLAHKRSINAHTHRWTRI